AGMGECGFDAAVSTCQHLAEQVGVDVTQVLPFSTGVIGQPLPIDKIIAAMPDAVSRLSETGWLEAAAGIMTTDT
ncbi:MAG TPA: bifunctional ornithine acetyltransferase/N-acetylglutamate synthase, partial [Porticoccaceae bacterium]|nr:bifunctional ornithine acetyltransferase/N-acetylglutamate synthase [Porticoccaceae bacterium]